MFRLYSWPRIAELQLKPIGADKMEDDDDDLDKTMVLAPSALKKKKVLPKAKLVCVDASVLSGPAGAEISLEEVETTLGRGEENTVSLKAEGISRMHARFFPSGDIWGIEDLGSTNGIKINGSKAHEAFLKHGDMIKMGARQYQFMLEGTPPPEPTQV